MTQGERLRAQRHKRALTQVALADKAGLRQATISDLERNVCQMDVPTAKKLAKVLRVKWTLFYGDDLRDTAAKERGNK
jgi:transcriptional regulator with XRE-family HTH domain